MQKISMQVLHSDDGNMKNCSSSTEDCQNVKPVRVPLFRPKDVVGQFCPGRHSEPSVSPALLLGKVPLPIFGLGGGGGGRAWYSGRRVA